MLKIPKEMYISESWLQIFVDQTMLWNDDRELRRYIQFLIDSDLAPAPSGRPANSTWSQALLAAEDNFSIDVIRYLQLASVENGGSPDLIERDDIPQEHWKDVYIGLRGTYRSYLGEEPYGVRKVPITIAIGLFEQALRSEKPIAIPPKYGNFVEPMSRQELLDKGLITPEHTKPEWLRNLNGSYRPVAQWVPADKDGNPIE